MGQRSAHDEQGKRRRATPSPRRPPSPACLISVANIGGGRTDNFSAGSGVAGREIGAKMKLVLVCGPFGSGTTAVAGLLARLGATGFGPYHHTRDEHTHNTYELIAFKELLQRLASEETLSLVPGIDVKAALDGFRARIAAQEFGPYDAASARPIFLKHTLAALVIPQICEVFETRLIYLIRPLRDIEATHRRRQWSGPFGAKAAQVIYSRMFSVLINEAFPTMLVRYSDLATTPLEHARRLADFAGLACSADVLQEAAGFIRGTHTPSAVAKTPDPAS